MTDLTTFIDTLDRPMPPKTLGCELRALWWAGKSEWSRAHDQVDNASGSHAAWVHAYLHRWEGDLGNAGYWYRRAGRHLPDQSLDDEWRDITRKLLGETTPAL
ncbi:hypothetical protein [Salinicola rhizosphaerae]|uniref:Uncharacterized protein n=1 Tax=Salinicola rhizosphaerae TaxID=1443141 RepID=A0ABQ3DUW8_9GAMM|nr:hypothetical protein [Salinicola rhizosphaerae]GHB14295.1 hypothetical protein GCM10009038_10780 [Salinicola rhizosphaerae]